MKGILMVIIVREAKFLGLAEAKFQIFGKIFGPVLIRSLLSGTIIQKEHNDDQFYSSY